MKKKQQAARNVTISTLLVFFLFMNLGLKASAVGAVERGDELGGDSLNKSLNQPVNLPSAILWYSEKAKNGDAEAQYNLANVYETGFGVEVNYELATKWYKDAAEQGHQLAQLRLGVLYILGKGVRESSLKGGKWIKSAARQGNTVAQILQDKVLSHNIQQNFDVKALVESVRKSLEKGEKNAEKTIVLDLQKIDKISKNAPEDSRFVMGVTGSGAKKGSVGNRIPSFLEKNPPKTTYLKRSLSVVRRHAKEGDAQAQYFLARMYEVGEKLEHSGSNAVKWYRAAADQGHGAAQYRLGLAYLYGLGTQPNIMLARQWLNKAILVKDPNAILLAQHLPLANNANMGRTIALSWYLERTLEDDGEAMLALGNMYEQGWGVRQDSKEATKWFIKAREKGIKGAAVSLRRMKANKFATESALAESGSAVDVNSPVMAGENENVKEKPGLVANMYQMVFKYYDVAKNAWNILLLKGKKHPMLGLLALFGIIVAVLVFLYLVFRWGRKRGRGEPVVLADG